MFDVDCNKNHRGKFFFRQKYEMKSVNMKF